MRRRFPLLFWMMGTAALAQPTVDLRRGLVACYPFSGNAREASGQGPDGRVNGATLTADRFGNPAAAYLFNGTDDYIDITSPALTPETFTFSLWARAEAIPVAGQRAYLFSVGSISGDQSLELNNGVLGARGWSLSSYSISDNSGGGRLLPSGGVIVCQTGALPPLNNRWVHLVAVRDQSELRLYFDGKLVSREDVRGSKAQYGTAQFRAAIGCRDRLTQFFRGAIDDVHLYNRPLSDAEIRALFEGTAARTLQLFTPRKEICGGRELVFSAQNVGSGAKVVWWVDGTEQPTPSPADRLTVTFPIPTQNYQGTVAVEVRYDDGCFPAPPQRAEQPVLVKACYNTALGVFVPEAFSPNHDGLNDTWAAVGLEKYPEAEVEIYSRWGERVFVGRGSAAAWDGTLDGTPLPAPSGYEYRLRLNADITLRGRILLLK